MRTLIIVILVIVAAFIGWKIWNNSNAAPNSDSQGQNYSPAPNSNNSTSTQVASSTLNLEGNTASTNEIVVTSPAVNAKISSPLTVTGKALGNWYFEASAPVLVYDSKGVLLGQGPLKAVGDWMTTNFVNFTGSITFTKPSTTTGYVVFKNDNPSGDPARSKYLVVPVSF